MRRTTLARFCYAAVLPFLLYTSRAEASKSLHRYRVVNSEHHQEAPSVLRKSLSSRGKAEDAVVDPDSLCLKSTLLSIEDPAASKYGSMKGWMTQDDWGAELRKIDQSAHRYVKIGLDGFPCASRGCCQHNMTIRLGGSDWYVVQHVINEYADFLRKLLPWKPKAILEGGGNIGVATSLLAFLYPDAEIIALEPEPENCKLLMENTKVFENVKVTCLGLWEREQTSVKLSLPTDDNAPWAWRLTEVEAGTEGALLTTSVPALLKKHKLQAFDMAKIDIEGAEFNVFRPGTDLEWLSHVQVLQMELHGRYGDVEDFRRNLTARGFVNSRSGEYDIFSQQHLGLS